MISKVEYKGGRRTEAFPLGAGETIITDAPIDNEGKGEAFSPTDLVATALASCMLTIIGIVARRDGIDIEGVFAEVNKIMAQGPRRIGEVEIKIFFKLNIDKSERSKLERAAYTCPVSSSLSQYLKETIEFIYP